MNPITIDVSEEQYDELLRKAQALQLSIEKYAAYKLFNSKELYTVENALKIILSGNLEYNPFTLPEVFGIKWDLTIHDAAGALGVKFNKEIERNPDYGITCLGVRDEHGRMKYKYDPHNH